MSHGNQGTPISLQPSDYNIRSNFKMFPGEKCMFESKVKVCCCCCGPTYYTTVTDTRYVSRREDFVCCGPKPYAESCIYLQDIAELQEKKELCCSKNLLCRTFCQPLFQTGCCCLACCCVGRKILRFRGSFGFHDVQIVGKDIPTFETMIARLIAEQKSRKNNGIDYIHIDS